MDDKKVRVIVLRAAGTNCDIETKFAFDNLKAHADLVHINKLINGEVKLNDYHILAIPGGFTYGDDISAGVILATQLIFKLRKDIEKFVKRGKLVIGICNGFQVLVKAGILPGDNGFKQQYSLTLNDSAKFEDRWVYLRTDNTAQKTESRKNKCIWTKEIKNVIYLPIAHAEGKFIAQSDKDLKDLRENDQIVFQYVNKNNEFGGYPVNPNGSQENIAGICDKTGRILGMMPHPERNILSHHHPRWTRSESENLCDGLAIFQNGINYIKTSGET